MAALVSVFQPLVEPLEEVPLPVNGVLRLEDPVVLVGEEEHPRGYAEHLGCVEGGHALVYASCGRACEES